MIKKYIEQAYCSVNDFAKLLKVHRNTVLSSIKKGRLNAFRIGSGPKAAYRIPLSEIERIAWMDKLKKD